MSADRELLEMAAKAHGGPEYEISYGWLLNGKEWNPIDDDGDRYRLAQKLGLAIDFSECEVWKLLPGGILINEFWGADFGDEAHAIVRAAAEIGRAMP